MLPIARAGQAGYNYTPQEREGLLSALGGYALGGLQNLGLVLDTPGAAVRGLLAGDVEGAFSTNPDRRVSGTELLEAYGIDVPDRINVTPSSTVNKLLGSGAQFTTGLATEILLDPLMLGAFGKSAGGAASRILKKTPYSDDLAKIATRKQIQEPLEAFARRPDVNFEDIQARGYDLVDRVGGGAGRQVVKRFEQTGTPLTKDIMEVMPPIGPRAARKSMTLADVVEQQVKSGDVNVLDNLRQAADSLGVELTDDIMRQPIGGDFSVNLPGGFDLGPFNVPGLGAVNTAFDTLGKKVALSPLAVALAPRFQKSVGEATDLYGQLLNKAGYTRAQKELGEYGVKIKGFESAVLAANRAVQNNPEALEKIGGDLASEEGVRTLRRLMEGPNAYNPNKADEWLMDNVQEVVDAVDLKEQLMRDEAVKASDLGLDTAGDMIAEGGVDNLDGARDSFGIEILPRFPSDFADFGPIKRSPKADSMDFGVQTASDLQRQVQTPGGTDDLVDLGEQEWVKEFARQYKNPKIEATALTENQAKDKVLKFFGDKYGGYVEINRAQRMQNLRSRGFSPEEIQAQLKKEGRLYLLKGKKKVGYGEIDGETYFDAEEADVFINDNQLGRIVGLLKRLDPEKFDRPAGQAIQAFGTSPSAAMARFLTNQSGKIANAEFVYDTLANSAIYTRKQNVPGSGFRSLDQTINELQASLGFAKKMAAKGDDAADAAGGAADTVVDQLKNRLLERMSKVGGMQGFTKERLSLKDFSVPDKLYEQLQARVRRSVKQKDAKDLGNYLNAYTAVFKNIVLTTPRRFVRDFYSNGIAVYLETGNAKNTIEGIRFGRKMLLGDQKNLDDTANFLLTLPRYKKFAKSLSPEEARKTVIDVATDDIARSRLLSGLSSTDVLRKDGSLGLSQFLPGSEPKSVAASVRSAFAPLADAELSLTQKAKMYNPFTVRGGFFNETDQLNPIYKAAEEVGDTVDSIGRLGGYFALLKQGVTPEQATKRMKAALIDYNSLTNFERDSFVRLWMPFWSYNSRIGVWAGKTLFDEPGGRFAQLIRGAANIPEEFNEAGYQPKTVRDSAALQLYKDEDGTSTYLSGLEFPGMSVIKMLNPNLGEMARDSLLMTNPLLKSGAELAFGQDLFTGRPLSAVDTTPQKVARLLGIESQLLANPLAKIALKENPLAYLLNPLAPMFDDRIDDPAMRALKAAVNVGAGVKMQTSDQQQVLADQQRMLGEVLSDVMKQYDINYIPEELRPTLTGEQQAADLLLSDLKKDQRAATRREKARR